MSSPTPSQSAQHRVIAKIKDRLQDRPLPILRKTVGRVVGMASRLQTDIGELSQTILQDQSFSAKILGVANGVYYRNRSDPIITVSRAIMQVGYHTIRDIAVAAEFVDMAQERLPEGVDIQGPLAKALLAAHQAKALAEAAGLPEAEGVFATCHLQNIGDFALALYLPDDCRKIHDLVYARGLTCDAAHQQILEMSREELTDGVMEACRLPRELVARAPDWSRVESWNAGARRDALVILASQIAETMLGRQSAGTKACLNDLVETATKALGLPVERVLHLCMEAFNKAYSLGKSLGLQPLNFTPFLPTDRDIHEDDMHVLVNGALASVEYSVERIPQSGHQGHAPDSIGSASLLVNVLKDLTTYVMKRVDFNSVVSCVLEGLHRAVGFDHAIVLFVVPGKSLAVARYGLGTGATNALSSFVVATDSKEDLLAHCMATQTPMRFSATEEISKRLPPGVIEAISPGAVALGPLCLPSRAVGIIWADRAAGEIDDVMWDSFQLLVMQANVALLRLSSQS